MILEGIEDALRSPKAEEEHVRRGTLTIEHVMPQEWRTHWPPPARVDEDTDPELRRDGLVQAIGNLTLVNNRLNPSLSNGPWSSKYNGLAKHSTLFLNKRLLESAGDVWNENTILDRADTLLEVARSIWPDAKSI